ncbi:MAG: hypothetical protein E7300_09760 [Lachnospiraceae bacterium]|nr:hypothetical protein [Lachnospiraceae bacterium]
MFSNIKKHGPLYFAGACFLIFLISMIVNKGYFEPITHESVVWYQCRQALAILLLYLIGNLFLCFATARLKAIFRVLFAFPIGMCLWVFVSYVSLLAGLPYTMYNTMRFLVMVLSMTYLAARRYHELLDRSGEKARAFASVHRPPGPYSSKKDTPQARDNMRTSHLHLIALGIAMLCSTGWLYVMISYDSLFYFINYGRALTVYQGFDAIAGANSFTLTNITQFLPLVCSYTAFWGLDQAYQIHAFLACNVVAAFGAGMYHILTHDIAYPDSGNDQDCAASTKSVHISVGSAAGNLFRNKSRTLVFAVLLSTILATSTCYIVTSGWFLSNMPCMVYIFFLYLTTVLCRKEIISQGAGSLLIGLCLAALALLRKDGIIYDAFFMVWMCSIELFSKKRLAALFAPAATFALSWLAYVRLGMNVGVSRGYYSSIANNKNITLVVAVIVMCYLYLVIGHTILSWICERVRFLHEIDFMYFAFVIGLLYVLKIHPDITIDDWDFAIRNLFLYPSSWGLSAVLFGILIMLSLVVRFDLRGDHFVWIGYALLNLISYCYVDNKIFWVNWDDSYNRVLMQIVPVMLLIVGRAFADNLSLREDLEEHQSSNQL